MCLVLNFQTVQKYKQRECINEKIIFNIVLIFFVLICIAGIIIACIFMNSIINAPELLEHIIDYSRPQQIYYSRDDLVSFWKNCGIVFLIFFIILFILNSFLLWRLNRYSGRCERIEKKEQKLKKKMQALQSKIEKVEDSKKQIDE